MRDYFLNYSGIIFGSIARLFLPSFCRLFSTLFRNNSLPYYEIIFGPISGILLTLFHNYFGLISWLLLALFRDYLWPYLDNRSDRYIQLIFLFSHLLFCQIRSKWFGLRHSLFFVGCWVGYDISDLEPLFNRRLVFALEQQFSERLNFLSVYFF